MAPLNTTGIPDKDPDPDSWIIQYLWLPYVLLAIILIGMALASFIHYHIQNRGKYADKKYKKDQSEMATGGSKPRKYRVTLNSRGVVSATDSKNHVHQVIKQQSNHSDMFMARESSKDSGEEKKADSPLSSATPGAYVNESYDSNCDSDKSLLNEKDDSKGSKNIKDKSSNCKGKSPKLKDTKKEKSQDEDVNNSRLFCNGRKAISMDTLAHSIDSSKLKARSMTMEQLSNSAPDTPEIPASTGNDLLSKTRSESKVNVVTVDEAAA